MTNKKHSKKRGFTLIEMLIVIVIIGILAAYLIPRISSAQGKARDVARQADIQQISSALVSYSLSEKGFPKYNAGTGINALASKTEDTAGKVTFVGLVDGGYISAISKDPSSKGVVSSADGDSFTISESDYYGYISNGDHFIIITYTDDPANGNYCASATDLDENAGKISTLVSKTNDAEWNTEFKKVRNRLADAEGCPADESYAFYLYAY